ncbi:jg4281, partial [Pararge aegeria aegeria]
LLDLTTAYAVEKLGILMQYEDDLEDKKSKEKGDDFQEEENDSETDWSSLARNAENTSTSSGSRGRKTYRGGVRKRKITLRAGDRGQRSNHSSVFLDEWTLGNNHLRGCYGVTRDDMGGSGGFTLLARCRMFVAPSSYW